LQNFDIHKLHLLPNAHIASTLIRSHFTVARVTGRGGRTPDVKVCQWVKLSHLNTFLRNLLCNTSG